MKLCSECGRSGDALYADGGTTVARCPLHPKAKLYVVEGGRVLAAGGTLKPMCTCNKPGCRRRHKAET